MSAKVAAQPPVADSILATSLQNFCEAAARLNLPEGLADKISLPKERIELRLSPIMPDGKLINVRAFIVRHSDILGPSKGGIRMTSDVTLDDVNGLGMEMTWKTALIGVPFGGGKSGICFDTQDITPAAKEVLIRSFTRAASRHIGPEIYVPAPDMGTNEADMGHIADCISYSAGTSITRGCFVTGKPVIVGGIVGRKQATGKGVVHAILAACEQRGLNPKDLRVVVQGFGNVGGVAAQEIVSAGAKVIAVADISGGLHRAEGIDVKALARHAAENRGLVAGFARAEPIDAHAALELDCDVLIPAAAGSQINAANAERIRAKMIAEGANAPTTPAADEMLNERGVFIIPDILCNAGGVFVSYLEYTQETQHEQMTLAEVESRLAERMRERFQAVYEYSQERKVSMRAAAMDLAVSTVVEGVSARGFYP